MAFVTVHLPLQVQLQMNGQGNAFEDPGRLSKTTEGFRKTVKEGCLPRGRPCVLALSAKEPETAADFVLANDGRGVAVADAMFVGEPVGALIAAEEGGARFQVGKPLGQLSTGYERDAGDEALVSSGGVRQRHWHLRVGSRFQTRLPHRRAADKTQSQPSRNVLFVGS